MGLSTQPPLSYVAPAIVTITTVFLLSLTLSKPLNGYGYNDPFAWHAAFMIVGFCFLMPLGVLSYVMDFGRRGNAAFPSLESRRSLHGILLFLSALCIVVGFIIAFTCHERGCGIHKVQNHMPWTWQPATNSPNVRSAHVVIGYIAVGLTVMQAAIGMYKAVTLTKTGSRVFPQHSALRRTQGRCAAPVRRCAAAATHRTHHAAPPPPLTPRTTPLWLRRCPGPPSVAAGPPQYRHCSLH